MDKSWIKLGQNLIDNGVIKKSDLEHALAIQRELVEHQFIGNILLNMGVISYDDLVNAMIKQLQGVKDKNKLRLNNSGNGAGIKKIIDKHKGTDYFKDVCELMGIVTHKLRNPLAGVSAATEVLREKVENDSNEKYFEMMIKEIDRMNKTIKELFKSFSIK